MNSVILHVLIDTKDKEDVFRDIQIATHSKLDILHQEILNAFDFEGQEMAAFYEADEDWDRGQEYPQIAMENQQEAFAMSEAKVGDLFSSKGDKGIYLYDFLRMWCFLIEVINTSDTAPKDATVLLSVGDAPKESDKEISEDSFEGSGDFNDSTDDDYEDDYESEDYGAYDDDYKY